VRWFIGISNALVRPCSRAASVGLGAAELGWRQEVEEAQSGERACGTLAGRDRREMLLRALDAAAMAHVAVHRGCGATAGTQGFAETAGQAPDARYRATTASMRMPWRSAHSWDSVADGEQERREG
jgi:hypothetical protein